MLGFLYNVLTPSFGGFFGLPFHQFDYHRIPNVGSWRVYSWMMTSPANTTHLDVNTKSEVMLARFRCPLPRPDKSETRV